mmetsp:Transcript_27902/g.96438  ORF Transcript_27902/g.96438 Transcript_27902/m.96438 type:complete len:305 (+) Transcript_27902:805-1719(+)
MLLCTSAPFGRSARSFSRSAWTLRARSWATAAATELLAMRTSASDIFARAPRNATSFSPNPCLASSASALAEASRASAALHRGSKRDAASKESSNDPHLDSNRAVAACADSNSAARARFRTASSETCCASCFTAPSHSAVAAVSSRSHSAAAAAWSARSASAAFWASSAVDSAAARASFADATSASRAERLCASASQRLARASRARAPSKRRSISALLSKSCLRSETFCLCRFAATAVFGGGEVDWKSYSIFCWAFVAEWNTVTRSPCESLTLLCLPTSLPLTDVPLDERSTSVAPRFFSERTQ